MDNRWVVLGQGLTILMYVGCGIGECPQGLSKQTAAKHSPAALGVLSWDHEAATMSSDLGQVVVSGIFLCEHFFSWWLQDVLIVLMEHQVHPHWSCSPTL